MRINQLSVSWQVTIRHENDVTHSYFQFNSLKFNSACFTGMNDDRLFAPKLHKSELVGLNNKHLFQIYWEGVHVSVCVWLCVTTSAIHTPFTLCVCASVRVCVSLPAFEHKVGLWDLCWSPDLLVRRVGAAVILMSRWLEWRRRDGVCVCVCVWIPGGLVFPLPLRDGSAPVWGTLIWTGPPLCDGTNHSTPRSLKPIIFLFKAGRAREAKRGEDGPCKKLPILSLEHGKNGLLARNRLMLNDPLRL